MNGNQRKPQLSVEEQIAHLKSKGVTFGLCDEAEARRYLSDKTYYFKVAAYRVLFDKRIGGTHDGEYVGLDIRNSEIKRLENDRYSGELARKYKDAYPVWVFIELISFGGFIDFYRFCSLTEAW